MRVLTATFIWIVACLQWLSAFEILISEDDQPGTIVFDGNIGRSWIYGFNLTKSSKQGFDFLTVDQYTGFVRIQRKVQCALIKTNSFYVSLDGVYSNGITINRTSIPLNVIIHGKNCGFFKENLSFKSPETVLISSHVPLKYGECIKQYTRILNIIEFLPSTLQKCIFEIKMDNSVYDIEFDSNNNLMTTRTPMCFTWQYHIFHGQILSFCGLNKDNIFIPLKLVLHSKLSPSRILKSGSIGAHHNILKRSTTNTPPEFSQSMYVKGVSEELNPGYSIATITATDPDSGENGVLTYSLTATQDGRSQEMFSIDPVTGEIKTEKKLDREVIPKHYFTLIATDNGRPPLEAYAMLQIIVNDVNDHAPVFEKEVYNLEVSEIVSGGTTVVTVRAGDADDGMNREIEYTITNPGTKNDAFRIDKTHGTITTTRALDREQYDFYSLNIQATDRALMPDRKTATATVQIRILDENDNKPVFTKSSYTVNVTEDIDASYKPVIAEIQAVDRDADDNQLIRYSITGGNIGETFAIETFTGQLSVTKALDFEETSSYNLIVRAQDSGSPARSNSTNVFIRVLDVNDNAPKFSLSVYRETVKENIPTGYDIITVRAFDMDDPNGPNSKLEYTIKDAPANMPIAVNRYTGEVSTTAKLDREISDKYHFRIEAKDMGSPPHLAETAVEVTVLDINDNAPIFNPRVYNEVISEEARIGTVVVTVLAHDTDDSENARVSYAITSGNEGMVFSIETQMGQGVISLVRSLNYKRQNRYILSVTASDSQLNDTASVFINVTDANTHRPIFQNTPFSVSVPEDTDEGTTVFSVSALDEDVGENARITYELDTEDTFAINAETGDIMVKSPLDREIKQGYVLIVTASDHGSPRLTDTADIEITIQDVNDESPQFDQTEYTGKILEDSIPGTSILTLHASDKDQGANGRIVYTFDGGNDGDGDFTLDPTSGTLRTARELDRETVSNYDLVALAVDGGSPGRSTSVIVKIRVDDVNDNPPEFESEDIDLYVDENSPIGSVVGQVEAIDPDEGINAEVVYSIVGGPDADSFSLSRDVEEMFAIITNLIELDYEGGKKMFEINVRARSQHRFKDATIHIHVQDTNDNLPELEDFTIVFNNFKNHFPTGEIGRIPARDPDILDKLRYRIISGNEANLLHLDDSTGMIKIDSRLNSDVPTNGSLQVSVSDGINEVAATCRLTIRLVTEDMLFNSITVRLNNIDQTAFLSPLYDRFVGSLASIIPTTEDNIFVINVQDDTEVIDQKILNVSFSVRARVDPYRNMDIFYSQQFLKERVYLQRALLAKLSTLEVMPFDDNICLREICLNYEKCSSGLRFGNASSFISSTSMLFRPIHPVISFKCTCPTGFTGVVHEFICDTEINMCFSNPCGGNGTCVRKEEGFTCLCQDGFAGDQCQYDIRESRDPCPSDVCKAGSRCRSKSNGGFSCEMCTGSGSTESCKECSSLENRNKFCELTTRSFTRGSFLMYPSLKQRHRFTIRLSFATHQNNGLLFYNGRYNGRHDFVALEMIDGQVHFAFSLGGEEITQVRTETEGGYNDGKWHEITVQYLNRTVTLTVGEDCDTEVSVMYGLQIGYQCAARATQALDTKCDDPTITCFRFLDLSGPFQLGGLPALPTEFQVQNTQFEGCMRDIWIDNKRLDLDDYVYNHQAIEGCIEKTRHCTSDTCLNGGTCVEGWGGYICRCQEGWGGKDCSQDIDIARRLDGDGYLSYTSNLPKVQLPWYSGVSFRTRAQNGLLMAVYLDSQVFKMELQEGYIQYSSPGITYALETVTVNDGEWHYLETRWTHDHLIIILDYGQFQHSEDVTDSVSGKQVTKVTVGGQPRQVGSSTIVIDGIKGCVENIRVGNGPNSVLMNPSTHKANDHCNIDDPCRADPCPSGSACTSQWDQHQCTCAKGRLGAQCSTICQSYNPCKSDSSCVPSAQAYHGYQCQCDETQMGQYCEEAVHKTCPPGWWGFPICGPCNCKTELGFDPACNKTTRECYCRANHYLPPGSDKCLPCDCYDIGSFERSCDAITGQCTCRAGVTGRRCDACSSRFGEVTVRGCEVQYDSCPRNFAGNVWWPRTPLDSNITHACPQGTMGGAARFCSEDGWMEPDMFPCMSRSMFDLRGQIDEIEAGRLKINPFVSKKMISELNIATNPNVTAQLYGTDINITQRVLTHILAYENKQTGLNLTHTQDKNFAQNLVNSFGRVTEPKYSPLWYRLHEEGSGAIAVLKAFEEYTNTLALNMQQLFTQPFDVIHENMVLGLDYIVKNNLTSTNVPKFNNKVKNEHMFDLESVVILPGKLFKEPTMNDVVQDMVGGPKPVVVVGYTMYRTLGNILPPNYSDDVEVIKGIPLALNSPLISINVVDNEQTLSNNLKAPVELDLKQELMENRSTPQCVYWKYTSEEDGVLTGEWSTEGCSLKEIRDVTEVPRDTTISDSAQPVVVKRFVRCECTHLTSFGALMNMASLDMINAQAIKLEIVTYIGVGIALLCLLVAFVLFCCLRSMESNANSIHINLVFVIFVANLVFIAGVERTSSQLACKLIAIVLHFFYLGTFTWMFVELLHLYRMFTEIRNINYGSMKFYYLLGYVLPGICVGLAVGLKTDGYGNNRFCFLSTTDSLIWSFAGPVIFIVLASIIIFFLAVRASCHGKHTDPEFSYLRYGLFTGIVLVFLIGLAWGFALLAVNDNVIAFHYLFAVFTCLQGVFILLGYIVFSKHTRVELKDKWDRLNGKKGLDDSISATRTSMLSRSALAYHHNSSLEGGLNRINVGISTNSTTSRSTTDKSSGGMYRPDAYIHSSSSNSANIPHTEYPPTHGIPPYGYNPNKFNEKSMEDPDTGEKYRKRGGGGDSDSDSDMSDQNQRDMDLASSHSSDDDDDNYPGWGQKYKSKNKRKSSKEKPKGIKPSLQEGVKVPPPVPSRPAPKFVPTQLPPLPPPSTKWPGENFSTTTASDLYDPPHYMYSDNLPTVLELHNGEDGILKPPERVDSLPSSKAQSKLGSPRDRERIQVRVHTHNGSISSESELSHETVV